MDIDAYEAAVKAALTLFGIRPNYDVAAEFNEARRARELEENAPTTFGLKKPSEIV